MDELIESGHIVDIVLGVIALEVMIGPYWPRRRGRVTSRFDLIMAFLPGLFLLLALRAALTRADWIWIAVFLAASFPAHLADLWRRPP